MPTLETDDQLYKADFGSLHGIRGGDLELKVEFIGGPTDIGTWRVNGTNPGKSLINGVLDNRVLQGVACLESGYRQFKSSYNYGQGLPLIGGVAGGVGIMQVNNPRPSDEAIWNWRQNIAEGLSIFALKQAEARNLPNAERARLNKERAALGLPACPAGRPADLSPEQLERETIRRYNCGREYRWEPRDAENCFGEWVISPTLLPPCNEQRDQNYVDRVLSCNIP